MKWNNQKWTWTKKYLVDNKHSVLCLIRTYSSILVLWYPIIFLSRPIIIRSNDDNIKPCTWISYEHHVLTNVCKKYQIHVRGIVGQQQKYFGSGWYHKTTYSLHLIPCGDCIYPSYHENNNSYLDCTYVVVHTRKTF